MRYLLDVNALIALGISGHIFHTRVATWVDSFNSFGSAELATTPITELGFVRILSQPTPYGLTVSDAKDLLKRVKATSRIAFAFIADGDEIYKLPSWVKTVKANYRRASRPACEVEPRDARDARWPYSGFFSYSRVILGC